MSAPNDQSNYPPWQLGPPVKDWDGVYRSLEEGEDEEDALPLVLPLPPLPPLPHVAPHLLRGGGGNDDDADGGGGGGGEALTPPPPNPSTPANARQVTATAASAASPSAPAESPTTMTVGGDVNKSNHDDPFGIRETPSQVGATDARRNGSWPIGLVPPRGTAAAAAGGGNVNVAGAEDMSPNQVTVDMENQRVILPVDGHPFPFHISTIKDVGLPAPDSTYKYLTIEIDAADMDSPVKRTFRSGIESDILTTAYRQISDLRQRVAWVADARRSPPDPEALDAAGNLLADPSAPPARKRKWEGPGLVYAYISASIPEEEREAFDEARKKKPMPTIHISTESYYVGHSRHPKMRKKAHAARDPTAVETPSEFLSAEMDEPERAEQFIQYSLHQSGDRIEHSKKDWFYSESGGLNQRIARWMEELEAGGAATATYTNASGESVTIDSKTFDYEDGLEFDAWKREFAPAAKELSGLRRWRKENPRKRKRTKKICSVEECSNVAQKEGLCDKHHSGRKKEICSVEGCPYQAVNNGVCTSHGAVVKRCSVDGCPNKVQRKGLCDKHGKTKKLCSVEGCPNKAQTKGLCKRHGAEVTMCSHEGCEKKAQKAKLCIKHGAFGFCNYAGGDCTNGASRGKEVCAKHAPEAIARREKMEAKRAATEARKEAERVKIAEERERNEDLYLTYLAEGLEEVKSRCTTKEKWNILRVCCAEWMDIPSYSRVTHEILDNLLELCFDGVAEDDEDPVRADVDYWLNEYDVSSNAYWNNAANDAAYAAVLQSENESTEEEERAMLGAALAAEAAFFAEYNFNSE